MSGFFGILFSAMFVENMPLTFFLGLCTFLALSKRPATAMGLGIAMIGVMGVTVPLNQVIYATFLAPGALAWAGMPDLDLSYLSLLAFIGVIAASVQLLEMTLERFLPAVHASFGVFLPLLTVQCAILAGSLFMVERRMGFTDSFAFGIGSGAGFALAVVLLGTIRSRLAYADLPDGLRGLGITFVLAGMMSLGFSSFAQLVAP